MTLTRLLAAIAILVSSATACTPASGTKDMPAVNDEGMELVQDSELATVYADPGADLGIYKRIWLKDATVSFKKNWQRDQNRTYGLKVRDSDMERIMEDVATIFRDVFTEELKKGGYEMVEEVGADVLVVKPAIVDLNVYAPDVAGATRTNSYSESAGEMTLNIELFDSITDDKIAKATDRQRDRERGYMQWRTRVSNRADAKRMMQPWAEALRSALDEAHAATKSAD